jgi:hypothetical protein
VKKNYRYEMIGRAELFWSFVEAISILWILIGGVMIVILGYFGIPAYMQNIQ